MPTVEIKVEKLKVFAYTNDEGTVILERWDEVTDQLEADFDYTGEVSHEVKIETKFMTRQEIDALTEAE